MARCRPLRGRFSGWLLCVAVLGLLGCDRGTAGPGDGSPAGAVRDRLAEKRRELTGGAAPGAEEPAARSRLTRLRAAAARRSGAGAPTLETPATRPVREPPAKTGPAAPASPTALPAHLPRRERLTRACYRDTFKVTDPSHLRYLLPREKEFCRCMVDTVISTGVSASLQDALIENFKDRDRVEAANPEFGRRWHRCRM